MLVRRAARTGFEIGSRDRLAEIPHAKDQRNPYQRAAATALRKGTKKRAGSSRIRM